ncbi:TetR/AcrR family transcriptional regulator [Hyphococcus luteus]|jgi:AcrR family transcriptional regulator|uniref:TetR/AcrR family transcriptional regulator n=1 Tax=Hyphococcus luteus TaxID=2058213 RepID=A0A2S7K489_9PROT|nr:TetR/AcrR family transcriptional regulator [Marinicaulis flavus]PQA87315.1 TetR/AcrR family transcriptional regulator [Marinicaulis flavus]
MLTEKTEQSGVTAAPGTTKARIERAALSLFCARGVDAVTTREIAAASGVSEGALYRHYPSKDALSQAMFFAIHKRLAEEVEAAAAEAAKIEDKARAIVAAYVRIADEDWTLFSYHLLTTHRFLPYADKSESPKSGNPVAIVEGVIMDAVKHGELPQGDAALKTAAALGVVLQTALHKIYGRVKGALGAHEEALARAVIAVLKS